MCVRCTWQVGESLWLAPFPLPIAHVELHLSCGGDALAVVRWNFHYNARLNTHPTQNVCYLVRNSYETHFLWLSLIFFLNIKSFFFWDNFSISLISDNARVVYVYVIFFFLNRTSFLAVIISIFTHCLTEISVRTLIHLCKLFFTAYFKYNSKCTIYGLSLSLLSQPGLILISIDYFDWKLKFDQTIHYTFVIQLKKRHFTHPLTLLTNDLGFDLPLWSSIW